MINGISHYDIYEERNYIQAMFKFIQDRQILSKEKYNIIANLQLSDVKVQHNSTPPMLFNIAGPKPD
jgi:hypothetical protein